MSIRIAKPEHEVAYQDLTALISKHAAKMSKIELLAVAANMLGKMIALQDQRTTTPDMAMEVVSRNIEVGNKQVIDEIAGKTGGHA